MLNYCCNPRSIPSSGSTYTSPQRSAQCFCRRRYGAFDKRTSPVALVRAPAALELRFSAGSVVISGASVSYAGSQRTRSRDEGLRELV